MHWKDKAELDEASAFVHRKNIQFAFSIDQLLVKEENFEKYSVDNVIVSGFLSLMVSEFDHGLMIKKIKSLMTLGFELKILQILKRDSKKEFNFTEMKDLIIDFSSKCLVTFFIVSHKNIMGKKSSDGLSIVEEMLKESLLVNDRVFELQLQLLDLEKSEILQFKKTKEISKKNKNLKYLLDFVNAMDGKRVRRSRDQLAMIPEEKNRFKWAS